MKKDSVATVQPWNFFFKSDERVLINFLENQRKGPNVQGTKSEKSRVEVVWRVELMVYTFKYKVHPTVLLITEHVELRWMPFV